VTDGTFCRHGKARNAYRILVETLNGRDYVGDRVVDPRVILKFISCNSVVVTQRSQLLLFVVGETCLATPLSREQSYMRAPISRLSGGTSQYYDMPENLWSGFIWIRTGILVKSYDSSG
jgi:hypothetical protein